MPIIVKPSSAVHQHIDIPLMRYLMAFVFVISLWGVLAIDFTGRLQPRLNAPHSAMPQQPAASADREGDFTPGALIPTANAEVPKEKVESLFTNLKK